MSDSNRGRFDYLGLLAALAIALPLYVAMIWDMSAQQARGEVEATYAARDYAESTDKHIRDLCVVGPLQARLECAKEIIAANRESERGERDLQAQEAMARWTFVMGGVAAFGVLISLIGVGLVYVTFRETRRAADAGLEANSIARETGQAQVRCYLSVMECILVYKGSEWHLGCKVKNTGQSPALKVTWEPDLAMVVKNCEDFQSANPEPQQAKVHTDISAGEPENLPVRVFRLEFTANQSEALKYGAQLTIRANLNITGEDVFGEQVTHEVAFMDFIFGGPSVEQAFIMTKAVQVDLADLERQIAKRTANNGTQQQSEG